MKKKPSDLFDNYETSVFKTRVIPAPIKKLSRKKLEDLMDWANGEIAEYDAFVQLIKVELRGRRK